MPLFDYKCPGCGRLVENVLVRQHPGPLVRCPDCDVGCVKVLVYRVVPDVFKPYVEHNLGPEDVLIDSRETLKREARKRGLEHAG